MWTAIITGLAALTGAAIGGLVTVWATHKTNVAAAERERAQRLHDRQAERYEEAKESVSRFLAYWLKAVSAVGTSHVDFEATAEVGNYGTRVQILLPDLTDSVSGLVALLDGKSKQGSTGKLRGEFVYAARVELEKLEPEA